jgi:sugar lactone lactonase YvrE
VTAVDAPFPGRCALGEGPHWDAARGRLLYVDIDGGAVHRLDPLAGDDRPIAVAPPVSFAIPVSDGPDLVCGTGPDVTVLDGEGRPSARWPVEPGHRGNRMNEGKADPAGRLWFGSMSLDRTAGAASLYRLDAAGLTMVEAGMTIANGTDWDLERRRMYHVDSVTQRVDHYRYDVETGAVADRRPFVEIDPADGLPDGLTLDADGCVWVCLFGGGAVRRYDPDGRLMTTVRLPVVHTTSAAFGGPDLSTLFVTSSQHRLTPAERAAQPLAGALFVADPDVRGRPPYTVAAEVAATIGRSGAAPDR